MKLIPIADRLDSIIKFLNSVRSESQQRSNVRGESSKIWHAFTVTTA